MRFPDVIERTLSDKLGRPAERTKREGREVAGVRRLGVLHCHSVIMETVLGLSRVICKTQFYGTVKSVIIVLRQVSI